MKECDLMDTYSQVLQKTLISREKDFLWAEIFEMGIDNVLEDESLKSIPIISTMIALYNTYKSIKTRNLFDQTLAFLVAVDTNTIPKDKLDAHKKTLDENPKKAKKERFFVLLILDQNIEHIQSLIFGSFYRAYLNQDISWNDFCELAEANRRLFVSDHNAFIEAIKNKGVYRNNCDKIYQIHRLISIGLLADRYHLTNEIILSGGNASTEAIHEPDIIPTDFGKKFFEYLPDHITKTI